MKKKQAGTEIKIFLIMDEKLAKQYLTKLEKMGDSKIMEKAFKSLMPYVKRNAPTGFE